ncbi:hypothetical protein QFZ42_001464 [Variovorax paradoxus]|uniref:hypothetical protein n=1 Tax=Variovorax paradoxus TaxID=34073 RepID=UPI00278DA325|nr:hypothetical protein [Variovorax paradoxus]MDQ0569630.1 hypothetical protein [Variovorax paradoxus]
MTKLWSALLTAAALLSGCAAPPAAPPATSAPAVGAVQWHYVRSTSYEARQPGLGISHRHESKVGWVDVYVYGMKRSNWAAGIGDPEFDEHFRAAVDEVRLAGARGVYANVEVGPVSDELIEGQAFRRVSFRVLHAASQKTYDSFTYLTGRNGRLLKYRMSFAAPAPANLDAIAREFIERNLRSGPDTPRAAHPLLSI